MTKENWNPADHPRHPDNAPAGKGGEFAPSKLTASVVSGLLSKAGIRPLPSGTPRSREGIRVSDSMFWVLVSVDVDSPGLKNDLTRETIRRLGDAGLDAKLTDSGQIHVTRSGDAATKAAPSAPPLGGGLIRKVGPFTVNDSVEFTMGDLRKIGRWTLDDGTSVFVDYDGTGKGWIEYRGTAGTAAFISPAAKEAERERTTTRRRVLKAMVTRRDNKRRVAERQARAAAPAAPAAEGPPTELAKADKASWIKQPDQRDPLSRSLRTFPSYIDADGWVIKKEHYSGEGQGGVAFKRTNSKAYDYWSIKRPDGTGSDRASTLADAMLQANRRKWFDARKEANP